MRYMPVKNGLLIRLGFGILFVQNAITVHGDEKDFAFTTSSVVKKKDHLIVTTIEVIFS